MPRKFITEKDIEDMVRRGERTLQVNDSISLTDLAYEKARKLGVEVIQGHVPSAPLRPYLVNNPGNKKQELGAQPARTLPSTRLPVDLSKSGLKRDELHERIRSAVVRKLGDQVDPKVVDTIIRRILDSTGVR
jgi:hypothetical protein